MRVMGSIERYVARQTLGAFVLTLVTLTGVIWVTQALREFDLLTSKGQTTVVFLTVTMLSVPILVLVIAPVAFFIAMLYVLGRLHADSELVVMNAAGISPWHVFRPFLWVACLVCVLVAIIALHVGPAGMRKLREMLTQIRADVVASIIQEGRFTELDRGLVFHIRERDGDGNLSGIFVADNRDPAQSLVYLAERGQIVEAGGGSFLVLERGAIHRREPDDRDPSIVIFDRYAFDLSQFGSDREVTFYRPRERFLAELIWPDENDPVYRAQVGRFRAELHDRLTAPLYPLALLVIAYAMLGRPRTTRQGRGFAIANAIMLVVVFRVAVFYASGLAVREPWGVALMYAIPIAAIALGLLAIDGRINVTAPPALVRAGEALGDSIQRLRARFAPREA